jgi:RNA polymerase sigma-B factor
MCADSNFTSLSIDHMDGGDRLLGNGSGSEHGYAAVEADDAFEELLRLLPSRLRRIVHLRYVEEMKQSDIAAEMGVSQVQISRLLRNAADRLRPLLEHRGIELADASS